MCVIKCTVNNFVAQHISWTYDGVIAIYTIEGGQGDPESRCYIEKCLDLMKYLVIQHTTANYGSIYMVLDWHATYSKTRQKTQSYIDENTISSLRHFNHHY